MRLHGLIHRIPGSHRYQVTDLGFHVALLFTRVHNRVLRPGLAQLRDPHSSDPPALRRAYERLNTAIDTIAHDAKVAA